MIIHLSYMEAMADNLPTIITSTAISNILLIPLLINFQYKKPKDTSVH